VAERYTEAGRIYLIGEDGQLTSMAEEPYDSEDLLQSLLANHPALLAGEQMCDEGPRRWLLLAREATVAAEDGAAPWYVDHLFVDQDAVPTLVEVKRSSDTRIRREVIGQMLDYAANATTRWSADELRARYLNNQNASERLDEFLDGSGAEPFWNNLAANLAAGRIRMVFVADVIPAELRSVVDFLAAQLKTAEVFAIEVRNYRGVRGRALVPRLVSTRKVTRTDGQTRQWDEASFFTKLGRRPSGETETRIARSLLNWARKNMPDLWYGQGASDGSCIPRLVSGSKKIPLFALWTYGTIEMQFQHLNCPPFDGEDARLELIRRLNEIEGVSIPNDAIARRPTFNMVVLASDGDRRQFEAALEWAIEQVRLSRPSA
jgi:hypothetical protein